ncbi:COX15/CtaA family protein [Gracilimonas mengyeensis]|uniref:Cytochrome c oxidase assembly protein subunit 15 n=1 Tax=Gracilimonas mengyeensis TaxID=1302730 RepID=A0A521DRM5_9BACT|nr:COX15/CtaA family protein [Gracilimonas mengyeensis]SMO74262.1 cytochrome c oxidase assembly protein subunit 15 [Gracilimonas mengyeensis]
MKLNAFQKTAIVTVAATLFLILIGGLVRAAGAGLGCPDWPKCFGLWIPPTSLADLPAGFSPEQFNVYKTWIEYVNRLVGVVIGLLITATFVLSFKYRKDKPAVFYSSFAAFVLVLFQGWLGGVVVRTGLHSGMITAHMLVAMLIVMVLVYATFKATSGFFSIKIEESFRKKLLWSVWILLTVSMIQLVLGTQVREAIDVIKNAAEIPARSEWLNMVGNIFEVHRSSSWVVLIAGVYMFYLLRKNEAEGILLWLGQVNLLLIIFQIAVGVGLLYLDMARILQVLHLVGMAFMICAQFLMIMVLRSGNEGIKDSRLKMED